MQKRIALGKVTPLAAGLLLLLFEGLAAEPTETVAVACESVDHIRFVTLVINFTAGTVQQDTVPYPVNITFVSEQKVEFTGEHSANGRKFYFHATIDRVNGNAAMIDVVSDQKTGKEISSSLTPLKCRATKRVF